MTPEHHHIIVVGTGFSGLGAAIQLKRRGIDDFVILERYDGVGGTWRDNSYPGCACDVPSRLYSFSFAPNPDWSRRYSPQPEIWAYMEKVARDYGVLPHVRDNHELIEARWDDVRELWELETSQGRYTADVVISGMGGLSEPAIPNLPGLENFKGKTFHSAQWDHEHQLEGERVAVIGTGASSIQFVPQIQPQVGQLDLYQRTPPWIVPRMDRAISKTEKRLFKAFPPAMQLVRGWIYAANEALVVGLVHRPNLLKLIERFAGAHLARQVRDPELRRKLKPDYRIGCKRILRSDDYYPSLTKDNVDVITAGIKEIREHSIVTADGTEREVDTIIFGTGFHVTDMPLLDRVRGRGGELLKDHGHGTIRSYWGTMIDAFPNLFVLLGPNVGLGHTSIIYMIESQLNLVMDALETMQRRGVATVEPRAEAVDRWVAEVDRRGEHSVWLNGGCASWYLDATGRNATLWPDFTFNYRRRTRHFVEEEYELGTRAPAPEGEPVAV
jgi:cation diffusion facilitator CzcD-associated flavoprotein CzcO